MIWAKLKGSPYWPAKIERIYGKSNQMLEIWWFNDYGRSKILESQAQPFLKHYGEHCKLFNQHIGLEAAAKEAVMYGTAQMMTLDN